MKKIMLLLLMIISIIPLISCKEDSSICEVIQNAKYERGKNVDHLSGYYCIISTNKESYMRDEIIDLKFKLILNCHKLGENIYIKLLNNEYFECLSTNEFVLTKNNYNKYGSVELDFQIKAIKETNAVKKLNIEFSLTSNSPFSPLDNYSRDRNKITKLSYIYIFFN